jgi:hypothetical protein
MRFIRSIIAGYLGLLAVLCFSGQAFAAQTPLITSSPFLFVGNGVPMTPFQITALNGPTSFSASGLPTGLTVNATSGVISGSPTPQGTYNVTIFATNSAGTAQAPLTINVTIVGIPPTITSPLTGQATVGTPYSYQIVISAAASYEAVGLPPGLSLNATTGIISGTPTTQGTYLVTLIVPYPQGALGDAAGVLALTVNPGSGSLPAITSAASAQGQVDVPFNYQITASNGSTSFYAGGLPPGLQLNNATGQISGTPSLSGTFNVLLEALNSSGAGSQVLALTINSSAVQVPVITSPLTATGIANSLNWGILLNQ